MERGVSKGRAPWRGDSVGARLVSPVVKHIKGVLMSVDEALGLWAEAAQDLSSAGLARAAGTTYNCADLCNQVAEKALQSVYLLTHESRAPYNHDLVPLGELV